MKNKILYVDDNRTFAGELKKILEEKGYQVSITTGAEEAVELVKKISPEIIFIDIETPPDNGLETYLQIRKINQKTPVVFVAEEWDELKNLIWEAMMQGAYACLYKPFEIDEILELIEIITEKPTQKKHNKMRNILSLLLLGFLFSCDLQAEIIGDHSGADFLKQGISVRASGLGEAVVALPGDVFATPWKSGRFSRTEKN